jgi:MFS family permease
VDAPIFTKRFRRVFAANVFSDLSFSIFVHFPGFLRSLGAREALIGTIASVAVLASVSLRPGVGQLMDHQGRLPIVRKASMLRVITAFAFLTIGSIGPWVFVVRAVYGVCTAVVFTGLFTYANDIMPPEKRTQAIALYGLSGMIPAMFGAALGDLVIGWFGFAGLFVVMGLLDAGGLLVIRTLKPLPKVGSFAQRVGFRKLLVVRSLRPVWALTLAFGFVFASLQTFMRTFVDTNGVGTVGLFFFAYSSTAVVLRITLSWLPDRLGFARVLYPVIGCQALGMFLLSGVETTSRFVIGAMLAGAGHAFLFPVLARLAVERSPVEDRGSASGLYTAMFDVAILVGGPVLGLVIERSGYPAMYRVVTVVVVLSALMFFWLERSSAPVPVEA